MFTGIDYDQKDFSARTLGVFSLRYSMLLIATTSGLKFLSKKALTDRWFASGSVLLWDIMEKNTTRLLQDTGPVLRDNRG